MTQDMNKDQFKMVAKLLRSSGMSLKAAEGLLVENKTREEVINDLGISKEGIRNVLRRFGEAHELLQKAYSTRKAETMTAEQFETIAKLIRSRDPSRLAAQLILIEGKSRIGTGELTGLKRNAVHNVLQRYLNADASIRQAYPASA